MLKLKSISIQRATVIFLKNHETIYLEMLQFFFYERGIEFKFNGSKNVHCVHYSKLFQDQPTNCTVHHNYVVPMTAIERETVVLSELDELKDFMLF